MSYEYLIGIRLATPDSSILLNQEPFSSAIFSAIEEYNLRSKSAPNPKSISLISSNFFKDSFIITLTSEKALASAGKALRVFSQIIANSGTFDPYIKNGKVFSTFPVKHLLIMCATKVTRIQPHIKGSEAQWLRLNR